MGKSGEVLGEGHAAKSTELLHMTQSAKRTFTVSQAAQDGSGPGLLVRGELVVPHRDRRSAAGEAARAHGQGGGLHRLRQELHRLPLLRRAVHAQQPHQQRQEALPLHVSESGRTGPAPAEFCLITRRRLFVTFILG